MNLRDAYALITDVANPASPEGLKKPRAVLLLWVLQHVIGLDAVDAYEHVCDGDNDQGIDGLRREEGEVSLDTTEPDVLTLMQCKYPESAKNVGVNDIKGLLASAASFESVPALKKLLKGQVEPELANLITRYRVLDGLRKSSLKVRLLFVTAGQLTADARRFADGLNDTRGDKYITCLDALDLAPLMLAFKSPSLVKGEVKIPCSRADRFATAFAGGRVAIGAVRAKDIASWPGIDDRQLFELNVRRELKSNAVRRALDHAIAKASDHEHFLAFHNGLTVVCEKIDDTSPDHLVIENMSIVNGAQSTVAFRANESALTPKLKVVVKFVEVKPTSKVAREVAVRSNTQNPVNARNLKARDGVQLRLEGEFAKQFKDIVYVTRPDASAATSKHQIANDDAAQLLCAVYAQRPWLAVKRLSLFDGDNYTAVFGPDVSAARIVLCDFIGGIIDDHADRFPDVYRSSWQLTRLVAVYLVGQLLRADVGLEKTVLLNPQKALLRRPKLKKSLRNLVKHAAATLVRRADEKKQKEELDDFKVEFKREAMLKELAEDARKAYLTYKTVSE